MSGWAGAGNIGDELLTRVMVARLRSLGAVPVVASRSPGRTRAEHDVESVAWGPRGLRAVGDLDGVCIGPGGILQDSSSLWSLPGHLAVALTARRRGLPVAAIGVGAEPLRRRSSGALLRQALGQRPVVTRDDASSAALRDIGLEPVTGADVVFGLDVARFAPTGPDHPDEIVVSVGGSVRPGLVSPASRRIEAAPVDEIAAAVDLLAEALGARVVLTRFRGDRDADDAVALRRRLSCESEVLADDVDEHVRRVCGARLVVSSRYHPLVLAALTGVPAVAVSDQAKVRSLVAQVDRRSIRSVGSWAQVAADGPPDPDPGGPAVPEGVERAHEALVRLVDDAGAARTDRSRG